VRKKEEELHNGDEWGIDEEWNKERKKEKENSEVEVGTKRILIRMFKQWEGESVDILLEGTMRIKEEQAFWSRIHGFLNP
jgi:hypothetical protein